jgi:IS5 family transposase
MKQRRLEASGFEKYRKKTRKEQFLDEMEQIIPWKELCGVIAPYYPNPQGAGRKPIGLERMLRIHFLQHWFELSDPAAEEALYDSRAMRLFVGIDLGNEPVPDETTICNFRHLMERNNLGDELFRLVNVYLAENGLKVNRGTIVDATIINAPSSTKNKENKRVFDLMKDFGTSKSTKIDSIFDSLLLPRPPCVRFLTTRPFVSRCKTAPSNGWTQRSDARFVSPLALAHSGSTVSPRGFRGLPALATLSMAGSDRSPIGLHAILGQILVYNPEQFHLQDYSVQPGDGGSG